MLSIWWRGIAGVLRVTSLVCTTVAFVSGLVLLFLSLWQQR